LSNQGFLGKVSFVSKIFNTRNKIFCFVVRHLTPLKNKLEVAYPILKQRLTPHKVPEAEIRLMNQAKEFADHSLTEQMDTSQNRKECWFYILAAAYVLRACS